MTNIVSSIKPEGRDNAEKPIVDDKQIWTSREMTKKAFSEQGFIFAGFNENLRSGGRRSLCVNVSTELFFAKSTLLKTNCREHQCNAKTEGT
jgi:hypothetical protein